MPFVRKVPLFGVSAAIFAVLTLSSVTSSVFSADTREAAMPLAVVNGDTISTSELEAQFMSVHRQIGDQEKASFDYRKLLDKLVNDRLILQDALVMGIDTEENFVEEMNQVRDDLAMRYFVAETFKPNLEIAEDTLKLNFRTYLWKIQYRTVAVATSEDAAVIYQAIVDGAPMDSIATAVSLDSRRFKGGLDNLKFWGDVPVVFRNAAFKLKEGELAQPFVYRESYMVLRVEQVVDADEAEFENHRRDITMNLQNDRKVMAWENFIDSIGALHNLTIDAEVINDIRADAALLFQGEFLKGSDRLAITVGTDLALTEADVRRKLSHSAMKAGDQTFETILKTTMDEITEENLLRLAARQGGYLLHPKVERVVQKRQDSLLLQIYLEETVASRVVFEREEFQIYYDEHQEDFREPDNVRLLALQIEDEQKAEEAAALLEDNADFGYVSKKYAKADGVEHDPNEWHSVKTFPGKIGQTLDSLGVGQTTPPFPLSDGWVIFKIKAKQEGRLKGLDEVDVAIREIMFQQKFGELLDELLDAIKQDSEIEYFEDTIERYLSMG